jgi:protease II
MRFLPANKPDGDLKIITPRENGIEYFATHHSGTFFIATNEGAKNFKLMKTSVANTDRSQWQEIITHRADVMLEGVDAFENYLVLQERKDGLKQIRISDPDGVSNVKYVTFPEPAYYFEFEDNSVFESNLLRFKYSSLVTPYTIVDIHMDTGEWEVKKVDEIKNYDKADYVIERIFATALDGTQVPYLRQKSIKFGCESDTFTWIRAAPTWMRSSSRTASVCWTVGLCSLSDTFAAARTWDAIGTKTARCSRRKTRSLTSLPVRSI